MTSGGSVKFESRIREDGEDLATIEKKTLIFGKTEYRSRKVVMILEELGGKKVKVRMKVVEEEISWIIRNLKTYKLNASRQKVVT